VTGEQRSKNGKSGASRSSVDNAPRFNDAQFVQYELDKTQEAACKAQNVTEADIFASIMEMIDDGYKFTIKWDSYGECYACFIQAALPGGPNSGSILTGRGSQPYKAVKQALYKHHVCLQGDWAAYLERRGHRVIDD